MNGFISNWFVFISNNYYDRKDIINKNNNNYLKACKTVLDGPPACRPAGAFNFNKSTLTILHKNNRFKNIERQTGATKTFVYGPSSFQQLKKRFILVKE